MSHTTSIHGYPVLASVSTRADSMTRPGRFVLVYRKGSRSPFVVAWQGGTPGAFDSEWSGGDYCDTLEEAAAVYCERSGLGSAAALPLADLIRPAAE
jgi:hypothetical protein